MSDSPPEKLARRRFLADLLFVGGSLVAAALLGRLQETDEPPASDFPSVNSYSGGLLER